MSALTICNCVLKIKNQSGVPYGTAELVFEPRKSQINSADAIYLSKAIRAQSAPSVTIQSSLQYISVVSYQNIVTIPTIQYTSGGTAGSEVVTVTGSAITIQIASGTSTAAQIQTAFNNSPAATAIASCILSGTSSTAQTATSVTSFTDEVCYMPLSETTTNAQQSIFSLNWNDGSNYSSIVFDPFQIPATSYCDLSSFLTVSRG